MSISSISASTDYLLGTVSQMQAGQVQAEISTAVLKSIMDQQEQQAQALIGMLRQGPSPDGTGRIVDVFA